jgi:long-chain fatty acid transport protein
VSALYSTSTFTFDGDAESFDSKQGTKVAPHAWLQAPLTARIGVGFGLWAPYGLATAWPLDFEGRFDGYDNVLRGIYVQPTIAGELVPGRLALGGGVVAVRGTAEVLRRIDLARTVVPGTSVRFGDLGVADGTDFAAARLTVDDWSATFHLGVQLRASDRWSFGLRYLHTARLDLTGEAAFRQVATGLLLPGGNPFGLPPGTPLDALLTPQFQAGGVLDDQRIATELTLPSQLVAGVRFLASRSTRAFFDYQWTGWDDFDRAVLSFATAPTDTLFFDYGDASTLRFAIEHVASDAVRLRGGILHNTAAAPDVSVNPLLPEAERTSFAGGLGWRLADRFSLDLGVEVLLQEERRGRVRPRTNGAQDADELNVGSYSAHGVFSSIMLVYDLGRARR